MEPLFIAKNLYKEVFGVYEQARGTYEDPNGLYERTLGTYEHVLGVYGHLRSIYEHVRNVYEEMRDVYEHTRDVYEQAREMYERLCGAHKKEKAPRPATTEAPAAGGTGASGETLGRSWVFWTLPGRLSVGCLLSRDWSSLVN